MSSPAGTGTATTNAVANASSCQATLTGNIVGVYVIIVACEISASTVGGTLTESSGAVWTKVATQAFTGGVATAWVRQGIAISSPASITYTGTAGATVTAFQSVAMTAESMIASDPILQITTASGSSGSTPALTFASTPRVPDLVAVWCAQAHAGTVTNPSGFTSASSASTSGIDVQAAYGQPSAPQTVTWGGVSAANWAVIGIEVFGGAYGTDEGRPSEWFAGTHATAWTPSFIAGAKPSLGENMLFQALQSTAIEIDVFLLDATTGQGFVGSAGTIVSQIRNPGGDFATFAPTSVTSRGNGHFAVVIASGTTNTLGINRLRFTTPTSTAQAADGYALDVIAYDRQDAVRLGLSAIPNAAAAAVGGLATITAVGQAPGGVLKPNSMEDNLVYSSGKLTSSRLRIFPSSAALGSAVAGHSNNTDGEVERYVSAVTYNMDDTVASFAWTKQL